MARDRRLNISGGTYHVMNRGNRKGLIFDDDRDRRRFLRTLSETVGEYQVHILAGVLMGNHFHLVILTPHGNLSEFMQQLEGRYAQYYNWRHSCVGHLFQGRFKAVFVENDIHLFTAFWYVANNPVASRLVGRPEDWKWSSYAATVGSAPIPPYLSVAWLETLFPAGSIHESQQLCRQCMNEAQPVQAYLQALEPTTQVAVRSYIGERLRAVAQPCSYRNLTRPPIEQLFPNIHNRAELESAIALAHETHGFKLAEIARCTGLHYATVSKIYCARRKRGR